MASQARLIKVGPADRHYYSPPQYFDLKGHKELSQIFISVANDGISSIQFQYVENGYYVLSNQYGYQGNVNEFHTIELNHPAEYITGINGVYSSGPDTKITDTKIKAITFTTNVKQYGPFGVPNSILPRDTSHFTYNLAKSCQFGGFHGAYNSCGLLSIGFYLDAKTVPPKSAGLK